NRGKRATSAACLLPNTKLSENPTELLFTRNLTGDLAEIVKTTTNIQGQQITGQAIVETVADICQCRRNLLQSFMVTGIGDHRAFPDFFSMEHTIRESTLQPADPHGVFCRNKYHVRIGKSRMQGGISPA